MDDAVILIVISNLNDRITRLENTMESLLPEMQKILEIFLSSSPKKEESSERNLEG